MKYLSSLTHFFKALWYDVFIVKANGEQNGKAQAYS